MATLTELQTKLTAIKNARYSGVLTVRHGDTSTTFRSISEMDRIISGLEKEIAELSGTKRRRVRYVTQTNKGY